MSTCLSKFRAQLRLGVTHDKEISRMENSSQLFGYLETEDILKQVQLKKELTEKAQQEERVYFSKRTNLLKDLIEILTCETIARYLFENAE